MGIKINSRKRKVMRINGNDGENIKCEGEIHYRKLQ